MRDRSFSRPNSLDLTTLTLDKLAGTWRATDWGLVEWNGVGFRNERECLVLGLEWDDLKWLSEEDERPEIEVAAAAAMRVCDENEGVELEHLVVKGGEVFGR